LNQKNTKECDKRSRHIRNELHMIPYIVPSNNVTTNPHSTSLHLPNYASLHFTTLVDTSLLPIYASPNYTSLHFITLSFGLTPYKFPTAPFHLTSHIRTVIPRHSATLTAFESLCAEIPNYTILPLHRHSQNAYPKCGNPTVALFRVV